MVARQVTLPAQPIRTPLHHFNACLLLPALPTWTRQAAEHEFHVRLEGGLQIQLSQELLNHGEMLLQVRFKAAFGGHSRERPEP